MRTVGVACVAVVLAALTRPTPAHADDVTPVAAAISASSTLGRGTRHAAWRAFDADANTAWCQAATDDAIGGALVVRFAQPVTVRALAVYRAGPAPLTLTVTSDVGAVTVEVDAAADDPTAIALPIGATRSLRVQLAPRPTDDGGARPRGATCLAELHLQLVDHALVYGAPPEALTALPSALTALDDALRRCDRKQLARLARFPVGFRELAMAGRRAYPTDADATNPRAYRRARDLPCAWAVFRDDDDPPRRPTLDGGIAPGVVRVDGGAAITTVYWELAWRARRWQLIALDTVFFE